MSTLALRPIAAMLDTAQQVFLHHHHRTNSIGALPPSKERYILHFDWKTGTEKDV